jgi:hypothetical protein
MQSLYLEISSSLHQSLHVSLLFVLAAVSTMSTTMTFTTPQRPRKKRPSLSPKKQVKPRKSDPYPLSETSSKVSLISPDETIIFRTEVSFYDDETKSFKPITAAARRTLLKDLRVKFPSVTAITIVPPFVFVEADPIPNPEDVPFMIGGLVAKFIPDGGPYPLGAGFMGEPGQAAAVDLPEEIAKDLKPFHLPRTQTLAFLFKLIPVAKYVTSFPQQILVETERMEDEDFLARLRMLPVRFGELNVGYMNGVFWFDTHARSKVPDPGQLDGQFDDTNYLKPENGGALRPGAILECKGKIGPRGNIIGNMLSNAGVKVRKGDIERITASRHCWDAVDDKIAVHGDVEVGKLKETYGDDIVLVEATQPFSNKLLEVDAEAQRFIHSDLLEFGDFLVMDSAFTGKQKLRFWGVRAGRRRPSMGWQGPVADYDYVVVEQGVCSVDQPVIDKSPIVRRGVCGTPLILAGRDFIDETLLSNGLVGGFMCYTDCLTLGENRQILYCFCQTVDELIDDGWEVSK